MAITRPIRFLLVRGFAAALALGAAGCSVYPSAPAEPAYDTDVLPIFQAHCTRCHDNNLDGGANSLGKRAGHDLCRRPLGGRPSLSHPVRPLL